MIHSLAAAGIAVVVAGIIAATAIVVAAEAADKQNPDQPVTAIIAVAAEQSGATAIVAATAVVAATAIVAATEEQ